MISIFSAIPAQAQNAENSAGTLATASATATPSFRTNSDDKEWDVEGEIVSDLRLIQKPSGQSGVSTFQIPWASLSLSRDLPDDLEFRLQVMAITPTTGTTEISLRRVAINIPHVLGGNTDLEAGLITHEFTDSAEAFWPNRHTSAEMEFPLQRFGYLPDSDYGFQLSTSLTDTWNLGLALTNGEGRGRVEAGQRKDFAVWVKREWRDGDQRSWMIGVYAVRGAYDSLANEQNSRERSQIMMATTRVEGLSAAGEYSLLSDPADALNNVAVDQVNLTPFAGTRVNGVAYAGRLGYAWKTLGGTTWSLLSRTDRVEPIKGDGNYAVASSQIGIGYRPRPALQWYLYNTMTSYGQSHSTAPRDQQSWRMSVELKFD